VDATVTDWTIEDVLDAAVLSMINARCRQAYVHDLRGALQSVHSSVELLSRTARRIDVDESRLDSITALAKRAMANQELSLMGIVDHMTMRPASADVVDLRQALQDAQLFLRNDTAHKDIRFEVHSKGDVAVAAPRAWLKSLLVGLFALCVDAMPAGTLLRVDLTRAAGWSNPAELATIEVRSGVSLGVIRNGRELLLEDSNSLRPQDLILSALRRLILGQGGDFMFVPDHDSRASGDQTAAADLAGVLRIRLPIASA
jgi:signal transduction histidine kinase